jgi:hypothetical protein
VPYSLLSPRFLALVAPLTAGLIPGLAAPSRVAAAPLEGPSLQVTGEVIAAQGRWSASSAAAPTATA